jgi:hypothetical protein
MSRELELRIEITTNGHYEKTGVKLSGFDKATGRKLFEQDINSNDMEVREFEVNIRPAGVKMNILQFDQMRKKHIYTSYYKGDISKYIETNESNHKGELTNGKQNNNIPKISTCVLESIDTDYSPGGPFSAYEITGQSATRGGTGMPVGIRLSLQFKETEIMTKSSFNVPAGMSYLTAENLKDAGYNQVNDKGEGLF